MRWRRMSVRLRLILIVGFILMAGFLTTNLISFQVSRDTLKSTILHNELPLTSSNIFSEIQADLLRPIFVSSLMSNDTFVKDWLLEGEGDPEQVQRYLGEIRKKYKVFTSFLISEKTKNYYHFKGIQQVVSKEDPDDSWYFRASNMKEDYEINIDTDQDDKNTMTIFVNYKVYDYQGKFLAITGVGLEVDSVQRIVSRYQENDHRNIYFLDKEGVITVRSQNSFLTENNIHEAEGIQDIAAEMLSKNDGYYEYRRQGENMLLTTRYIPDLHWWVVVEQRESDALRNLWTGFWTNLLIGAAIVAATILAIGYAINIYQHRLEQMANTDKLTGIGNRQSFELQLQHMLLEAKSSTRAFSLLLLDIDHFKKINDTIGHLAGDRVIRHIADVARAGVRQGDFLCRWGGEELIMLLKDCPIGRATDLAEKLRQNIENSSVTIDEHEVKVTVSIGVAQSNAEDDADRLVGRADAALYQAKENGRNQVITAMG